MQKIAPVYKKPDFSYGRAHFLSSEKILGKTVVPALPFNLTVIWIINLILYVALYYDWLRKGLNFPGRIHFKR